MMRLCLVISVVLVLSGCYGFDRRTTKRPPKSYSSIEYYTKTTNHTRITIPIMVHFDKALTDKLSNDYEVKTKRKMRELSRSIFKKVEAYYRHPSLNQNIRISLIDTKFIRPAVLAMDDDGSVYLKKYCARQEMKKTTSNKWWYSILLTGRDLYYLNGNGQEVRNSTGRGYIGGVCTIHKSCTVIEWKPQNMEYLLAHELGHSLGLMHDGAPYNECKPYINIMGNKYHPNFHPKSWSKCSRRDLERFIKSWKGRCLRKDYNFRN